MGAPKVDADLVADSVWALHKLTRRCEETRQWVIDAGGLNAVQHVLSNYPERSDIVLCAVWAVYSLTGLQGLSNLLRASGCSNGGEAASGQGACFPDSVAAHVLWVIFEVLSKDGGREIPEAADLMRLIVEQLAHRSQSLDVQQACCSAIDCLVQSDPDLGKLLVELGGAPLLVDALRGATERGSGEERLVRACSSIFAVLSKGSAEQLSAMRWHGTPEALLRLSMRGAGGNAEETALMALGQLVGLQSVIEAMKSAPAMPAVIRGGLDAITEQVSHVTEPSDVQKLPDLLQALQQLHAQMDGLNPAVKCRRKCTAAMCSTACALAPHANPGEVPVLDSTLMALLDGLRNNETDPDIIEMSVESLGRVALGQAAWRDGFCRRGALQVLQAKISNLHGQRRLLKYCFWFAATLAGLPFVAEELSSKLHSDEIVDAALCTIIDILDDDVEGEWILRHVERCSDADLPGVLCLVSDAMRRHPSNAVLQSRGCHCLALLVALAPLGMVPPMAVEVIFAAVRQHSRSISVTRDACAAFRALLDRVGRDADLGAAVEAHNMLVVGLQEKGAHEIAERALTDFATTDESELIEDAVVVLCALGGIEVALRCIRDAAPGQVRTWGVKALFEYGRQQPAFLRRVASDVVAIVGAIVLESPQDVALQQHAALLAGLCTSCAP